MAVSIVEVCFDVLLTLSSRYNLKRRVASLPPLSSETFAEKVLSAQANSSAAAAKAAFEKTCQACQKKYFSENAYKNHLESKSHKARVAAVEKNGGRGDAETASVMSSTFSLGEPLEKDLNAPAPEATHDPEVEAEFSKVVDVIKDASLEDGKNPISRRPSRPHHSRTEDREDHPLSPESSSESAATTSMVSQEIPISRCLFCNYDSPSLKLSIMHMTKFHGLFIPEQPYLVDMEGLITYLQAKISQNYECLFCHKLKNSSLAIQTHMRDKGHCMIAFDTEDEMLEVGQFYDFRSSYSDDEEEEDDDNDSDSDVVPSKSRDGAKHDDEGWETDSTCSLDSVEITALPIDHDHAYLRLANHKHHTHSDPRHHKSVDGYHSHAHSHHAAFKSDHELHMASGRVAGHRSLAKYYRQNLHNHPTPEERAQQQLIAAEANDENEGRQETNRGRGMISRGDLGMVGVSDAKKKEVTAATKRDQKQVRREQQKYQWGVEKRQNKQKHFRDPLLQ